MWKRAERSEIKNRFEVNSESIWGWFQVDSESIRDNFYTGRAPKQMNKQTNERMVSKWNFISAVRLIYWFWSENHFCVQRQYKQKSRRMEVFADRWHSVGRCADCLYLNFLYPARPNETQCSFFKKGLNQFLWQWWQWGWPLTILTSLTVPDSEMGLDRRCLTTQQRTTK